MRRTVPWWLPGTGVLTAELNSSRHNFTALPPKHSFKYRGRTWMVCHTRTFVCWRKCFQNTRTQTRKDSWLRRNFPPHCSNMIGLPYFRCSRALFQESGQRNALHHLEAPHWLYRSTRRALVVNVVITGESVWSQSSSRCWRVLYSTILCFTLKPIYVRQWVGFWSGLALIKTKVNVHLLIDD